MLREPNREKCRKLLRHYAMHHFFAKARKNKTGKTNEARPAIVKKPQKVMVLVPVSLGLQIHKSYAEREGGAQSRHTKNAQRSKAECNPSSSALVPPSGLISFNGPEVDPSVQEFLGACVPDMSELVPVFAQLGIRDERALNGVVAWPKDERVTILENWKRSGVLNDLQVETLRIAFEKLNASIAI
jgi:hypothetical protein